MTRRQAKLSPGKAAYVSKNRGLALLDEAIDQIEWQATSAKNQWHQESYRCDSGMCLAGWIAQLGGGQWAHPASSTRADYLIAEPEDEEFHLYSGEKGIAWDSDNGRVTGAHERAARLAELTELDADDLFDGSNTLADIKRLRAKLA